MVGGKPPCVCQALVFQSYVHLSTKERFRGQYIPRGFGVAFGPLVGHSCEQGQLGLVYRCLGHPSRSLSLILMAAFQCSNSCPSLFASTRAHASPNGESGIYQTRVRTKRLLQLFLLFFSLIFFTNPRRLMSVTPAPYSLFLSRNTLLTSHGGPWTCLGFTNQTCERRAAAYTVS